MKKTLVSALALTLLLTLCACGEQSTPPEDAAVRENKPTVVENAVNTVVPYDISVTDNDLLAFRITGIYHDTDYDEYLIKFYAENKLDCDILLSWDDTSVNGYMVDAWLFEEITAGAKLNGEAVIDEDDLTENGISSIDTITFDLSVADANEWDDLFSANYTVNFH